MGEGSSGIVPLRPPRRPVVDARPAPSRQPIDLTPALNEKQAAAFRALIAASPSLESMGGLSDLGRVEEINISGRVYEVLIGTRFVKEMPDMQYRGAPLMTGRDFEISKEGRVVAPRNGTVAEVIADGINKGKSWGLAVPDNTQSKAIAEQVGSALFLEGIHEFWTSGGTTCLIPLAKVLAPLGRVMPDGTIVRPYGPHQVVGQIPKGLASYVFDVPLFGLPVYGASPLTGIVLIREKA